MHCARCTQAKDTVRLSSRALVGKAFGALIDLDGAVWRTLRDMTISPGRASLDYINGARKRYVNPIKYYLVGVAISVAIAALLGDLDQAIDMTRAAQSPSSTDDVAFMVAMESVTREFADLYTILMLPLFALFTKWHYFRADKNYAEILSFFCFLFGHVYVLVGILSIVFYFFNIDRMVMSTALMTVYFYFAAMVFFDRSWWRSLFSLLISVILYVLAAAIVILLLTLVRLCTGL